MDKLLISQAENYITLYSEYGGYHVYSSLESETSSITIEHGF